MLKRLHKRSGNRYTILSILMIILMLYVFKLSLGGGEVSYPQTVYYNNHPYTFTQILRESSFKFVRKYGVSYEGQILLLKRSDKGSQLPETVYIYTSWRQYREYRLQQ